MRRLTLVANINLKHRTVFAMTALFICFVLLISSTPKSTSTSIPRWSGVTRKEQKKTNNTCTRCSPPGDQMIYIPLIDLPEAEGGEIVFNSRSPEAMDVTPVFYKRNGETVIADPVKIQSAEIRYVDIQNLLPARYRHEKNWGGFALSYYGANRQMWSQFRFLKVNGGSNVDEFFTVKDESRSSVYEAAWWMPNKGDAIVALGNITDAPTTATISFGSGYTRTVNLRAHGTELVEKNYRNEGTESVKIEVSGPAGSIVPTGIITTKDGSFNSVIRFYDPTKAKQPNLYANGFRVKGATPHMVLKNTTQNSIAVLPKIIPLSGNGTLTLSQVSLNPSETREVDLSGLMRAAKSRNDLDIVSAEITNWAAPGSIIGSLYATNNRTNVSYDVPLRDSGPYRSMTGAYPWRMDGDYKSIAYVTNVTDEATEFVAELAYDGGKFTLGTRKILPRETVAFDLEEIRNSHVGDTAGHVVPSNVNHGQFKWAQRGATNGKIMLVGRIEMVSRAQNISSSYSCPMDCGPSYEATVDFPTDLFTGESGAGTVRETASWNYGYTMGPYPASATWSLDNSIAEFDPSQASDTTITGVDPGTSNLVAHVGVWERYDWDGLNCVDVGPQTEEGGGPIDVGSPVTFDDVREVSTSNISEFFGGIPVTALNISGCGGERFGIKIRFHFNQPGTITNFDSTVSSTGMFALTNNPVDDCSICYYGNDNPPYTITYLRKIRESGNRAVTHTLQGTSEGRTFVAKATVTLVCQ